MYFPDAFAKRLAAEWSNEPTLREALENGDEDIVFGYLNDERSCFADLMSPRSILNCIRHDKIAEIQKTAERALRIGNLFDEFVALCQVQEINGFSKVQDH